MQSSIVEAALREFVADVAGALPRVLAGLVFLAVAAVLVRAVMWVLRRVLARALPGESPVYRSFVSTVVAVFLWFGVALTFLSVVGLGELAAALGTATGFVALGVAYALSNVIADAVAGVYLLRDPDFQPGDTVTVNGTRAEVASIELRKTRFDVPGEDGAPERLVRANSKVEPEWRRNEAAGADAATDPVDGA